MIVCASEEIALFFVSDVSASPQKPVNRAKRLKDCFPEFLQPDYESFSFTVGSRCLVWGRIQSREYVKKISEEITEKRVAYEVSVSKLELAEDEEED